MIDTQLCFALYSASRALTKVYAVLLADMGITYPQYLALMVLWSGDGVLVSDIAKTLEIDAGTATPLIQRLEKLGLVKRIRSDEDERRVKVFLTEKGNSYHKKALTIPQHLCEATGLNIDEAKHLMNEMNDIKANISKWLK